MKNSTMYVYSGILCFAIMGCNPEPEKNVSESVHASWENPVEAGRYLVIVSGCNDCHTDGYMMTEGKVPEENWLTGSPVGWQGPWGTTYPSNLRLRCKNGPKISG